MKISAKEQHGLRAMIELAGHYGEGPMPLSLVAETQGISLDYLEQIVPDLREAGLVYSTRGPKGGYELARSPHEITVGQVLRALDGDLFPMPCVSQEDESCERSSVCGARTVWQTIHMRILAALEGMTLNNL
jgi:Rrf2 family cysteine metabolism transcriptional repressor